MNCHSIFICDSQGRIWEQHTEQVRRELRERVEQMEKAEKLPMQGAIWGGLPMLAGAILLLLGIAAPGGMLYMVGLAIVAAIRLGGPLMLKAEARDHALEDLGKEGALHHQCHILLGHFLH
jgi:hypothetical protein